MGLVLIYLKNYNLLLIICVSFFIYLLTLLIVGGIDDENISILNKY